MLTKLSKKKKLVGGVDQRSQQYALAAEEVMEKCDRSTTTPLSHPTDDQSTSPSISRPKTASTTKKAQKKRSRKEHNKHGPSMKKAKAVDHDGGEKDHHLCKQELAGDGHYGSTTAAVAMTRCDGKTDEGDNSPAFPFPTVPDDHCESPFEAYQDITSLLKSFSQPDLQIYDPYYCDGSVVRHLTSLGLPNVYNRKEDCYDTWRRNKTPAFDVLITNPPYSGNHIERIVQFAVQSKRPWFLLLPQFVHKKEYYRKATEHIRPFYIVPKKRYVYIPPKEFRKAKRSDVHKKSSPFVSMWFCFGGSRNESLIRLFQQTKHPSCLLARSRSALRDLRRKQSSA